MPLVPLYGHDSLRQRLAGAVTRGALPASLLLQGPRGVGKQRLALWLGQMLLCTGDAARPCGRCQACRYSFELRHPDLHWFFPRPRLKDTDPSPEDVRSDYGEAIAERMEAGGMYPAASGTEGLFVATVRTIVQTASISPALGRRKVFVIGDAERMVPQEGAEQAASAFLKLLEEPPADTSLILTSSEPGALLPTIRSRVVALRVAPLPAPAVRAWVEDAVVGERLRRDGVAGDAAELVELAGGAPGRLLTQGASSDAVAQARRLLDAATGREPADRHRAAFVQGSTKARGSFSDALDALSVLLHERVRAAATRADERRALAATRAIEVVERAKEQASGNANPQLVSASLLRQLGALLQ